MNKIQEIWLFYKDKIIVSSLIGLAGIALFIFVYFFNISKAKAESNSIVLENKEIPSSKQSIDIKSVQETIKVDIKGEIKKPGMYEIKIDSRIQDLITLAGGLTQNADTSTINLSKRLFDEMVIIIYSKNGVKNFKEVKANEETSNKKCQNNEILYNDACISNSVSNNNEINSKVNINTATIDELMSISGIGESKAKAIIEYRNQNGNFKDISEIKNVSGIGEALFEKIKSNITV